MASPTSEEATAWRSSVKPDAAALAAEERKQSEFEERFPNSGARFIAFAVEATGRIGPSARKFLQEIRNNVPDGREALYYFQDRLNASIARCIAKATKNLRAAVVYKARADEERARNRRSLRRGGRRLGRRQGHGVDAQMAPPPPPEGGWAEAAFQVPEEYYVYAGANAPLLGTDQEVQDGGGGEGGFIFG